MVFRILCTLSMLVFTSCTAKEAKEKKANQTQNSAPIVVVSESDEWQMEKKKLKLRDDQFIQLVTVLKSDDGYKLLQFEHITEGYNPTPIPQTRKRKLPLIQAFNKVNETKYDRVKKLPKNFKGINVFFFIRVGNTNPWMEWIPDDKELDSKGRILILPNIQSLETEANRDAYKKLLEYLNP